MDEKTDIHFILRLIDEYKDKDEDEYYLDMEEKQVEENERNKEWFLNDNLFDSDDSDDSDYVAEDDVDSDDSEDETDNDSVASSVDEDDYDDDDDDVYKFSLDFNNFKESQNITIL